LIRADDKINSDEVEDITIGNEAARKRHILELSHPIRNGIVFNWDDMELVWRHGFENVHHLPPANLLNLYLIDGNRGR